MVWVPWSISLWIFETQRPKDPKTQRLKRPKDSKTQRLKPWKVTFPNPTNQTSGSHHSSLNKGREWHTEWQGKTMIGLGSNWKGSFEYPTRGHSTKLPKAAYLPILCQLFVCQLLSEYAVRCWDGIWSVEWSATEWWTFFKAPFSVHTASFFNVKYTIFKHTLQAF